ncbi:MAG TPA: transketolase [Burkholderiales bacterium]|nr:transketolase [Burkholderiales bacterium]
MDILVDKAEHSINAIRALSMDAVEKAKSGHPGTPMALAPMGYVLWMRHLRHNPKNPEWFDSDRFVLSAGHASMLLYSLLFLTGYDLSLEDIKNFRQWGSRAPGHPEKAPGIETTTGPLGQGLMNAVGMALAEVHLAARFNREGFDVVDHRTYVLCSDGDLMEGASHEAGSLAGHLGLSKLAAIYDDNRITIEGSTSLATSDDVHKRFEAYGWHVQNLGDSANDVEKLSSALDSAKKETERPSLIIVRSHIAYGAPNAHDTKEAHGSPLGEDEVAAAKSFFGWPQDPKFFVPEAVLDHMRESVKTGEDLENRWKEKFSAYGIAHPDLARKFEDSLKGDLPEDWDSAIPHFSESEGKIATRSASKKVMDAFSPKIPWLIGGSGDLAPSTHAVIKDSGDFEKGQYRNRNIHWGIREHVMCAASSGIALHGGLRPYASSFFIFTDYARPAIRLAAMMRLPVIYVMTHDSIGLGEDGPTHQPIEHLASFRAMPNINIIRPADANETAYAWRAAMARRDGPTMLVLSRQSLPVLDRRKYSQAEGLLRGAYVLSKEKKHPRIIMIASGSEVHLILAAQEELGKEGIDSRVVSMPSWELFRRQDPQYREEVLPRGTKRLSVEAGSTLGWCEWATDSIGLSRFGASARGVENFRHLGFSVFHIVEKAKSML